MRWHVLGAGAVGGLFATRLGCAPGATSPCCCATNRGWINSMPRGKASACRAARFTGPLRCRASCSMPPAPSTICWSPPRPGPPPRRWPPLRCGCTRAPRFCCCRTAAASSRRWQLGAPNSRSGLASPPPGCAPSGALSAAAGRRGGNHPGAPDPRRSGIPQWMGRAGASAALHRGYRPSPVVQAGHQRGDQSAHRAGELQQWCLA